VNVEIPVTASVDENDPVVAIKAAIVDVPVTPSVVLTVRAPVIAAAPVSVMLVAASATNAAENVPRATPAVERTRVSATAALRPVLVSPVNVREGAAAEPDGSVRMPVSVRAANEIAPVADKVPVTCNPAALTSSTFAPLMATPNRAAAMRYSPEVVSVAKVRDGADTVPFVKASSASIAPSPDRDRESVIAVARSLSVLFAQVEEIGVPVTTGLPAGRVYVPLELRDIS
jgi:hypothetical protein